MPILICGLNFIRPVTGFFFVTRFLETDFRGDAIVYSFTKATGDNRVACFISIGNP